MRRVWVSTAYVVTIVFGACVTVGVLLLIVANTHVGQDAIARLVGVLTRGDVKLSELRGRFPGSLRASRVEVGDKDGVWLVLEDVAVDWVPLALLGNHVEIERLNVSKAELRRLPVGNGSERGGIPHIDIQTLTIARLDTSASVSRTQMELSAQGEMHYASMRDLGARLAVTQRDGKGSYRVDATMRDGVANGVVSVAEKPNGLIAGLLGLSDIGPIALRAQASGARDDNRIEVILDAGKLHAAGTGTIDLLSKRADVKFSAQAPGMALRPDLSWESLALEGRARGGFSELAIDANAKARNLKVADSAVSEFIAHVEGDAERLEFTAGATGLKFSGLKSNPFERNTVELRGNADLKTPTPVVILIITHPSMAIDGRVELGERKMANATVNIPRLETFASEIGADIRGRGRFTTDVELAGDAFHVRANGKIDATGGETLYARLLSSAEIGLDANVKGADIMISEAHIQSATMDSRMTGGMRDSTLALDLSLRLSDLSRVSPALKGNLNLQARARGPVSTAKLEVTGAGRVASEGFGEQELRLTAEATGLPQPSSGRFRLTGSFDDAPITLGGSLVRTGRTLKVSVERGDWKSVHARADLTIPDKGASSGRATVRTNDLRDLAPLFGRPVEGMLDATLNFVDKNGRPTSQVDATATNIRIADARIGQLKMVGEIRLPADTINLALSLRASDVAARGISGAATAQVNGPANALGVRWDADLKDRDGNPAKITGAATLDRNAERLALTALTANYRKQTASLKSPAVIALHEGIAVQHLAARVGDASLILDGRLAPTLDATVSLQDLTADVLQPFVPLATGTLSATAALSGSLYAPAGTIAVQGQNLRFMRVPRSIAPARLEVRANLNGRTMSIDASLNAGPSIALKVSGDAPLAMDQAFQLSAKGNTDFAVLNPVLSAEGRNLRGQLALDARMEGTIAKPRVVGTAQLSGGEIQDYPRSLRVHDIDAKLRFAGDLIEIIQMSGRAGNGIVTGSGSLDLAAPGMPLSLTLQARNAQPVSSDRFRGNLDADIKVTGQVSQRLNASGTITIRRGETILPDGLPPRVVTLNIRKHGAKASTQDAPQVRPTVNLDLTIISSGQFFVRGHGLDAELEGDLHIGGTDANPIMSGGLTMRRGTLDLAGQTLNFTTGRVTFDGVGLRNRLDPTLQFTAETTSGVVTAKLDVTGYASAPKIQLSSTPQVPQDEILARLLFQQSAKELSPFQLAQLAQAAASIGGFGTGGFDPIASVRRSLGLDRLSVSSASSSGTGTANASQTKIEAGKYVVGGVYVAAKQGLGNTTEAEVQVDLTKNLKAKATVNTGTNAASTQGAAVQILGSSVGLSYQFEY